MRNTKFVIEPNDLQWIIGKLLSHGYRVIGPTVRDGAIVYDSIAHLDDLPVGWTDRQDAGQYRLEQRADAALFGYAVGPHSWKRFLHPPVERLWQARRESAGFAIIEDEAAGEPLAFIGVRACELRAIATAPIGARQAGAFRADGGGRRLVFRGPGAARLPGMPCRAKRGDAAPLAGSGRGGASKFGRGRGRAPPPRGTLTRRLATPRRGSPDRRKSAASAPMAQGLGV